MKTTSESADLTALTWPTLAWFTAWQLIAAPVAPAAKRKPAPARKRRSRRRAKAKILRFPQERVVRRPPSARGLDAEIIRLSEIA